ncbi:MAG: VanZ family protein [Candidatus Obscuribacterales bacterium]|nr:VanZ family protein [Candidatus Obscuribacterales bacterium]
MIIIFAFSHQPYSGRATEKYLGGYNVPVRKLGHVSEYMILFWLIRFAVARRHDENEQNVSDTISSVANCTQGASTQLTVLAFILTVLYAASDEWHQSFVPGRSSNWSDVGVDAFGIALGTVILFLWNQVKNRFDIANTSAS